MYNWRLVHLVWNEFLIMIVSVLQILGTTTKYNSNNKATTWIRLLKQMFMVESVKLWHQIWIEKNIVNDSTILSLHQNIRLLHSTCTHEISLRLPEHIDVLPMMISYNKAAIKKLSQEPPRRHI